MGGPYKADTKTSPEAAREVPGYALFQAQVGLKQQSVKPLRSLGGNVLEVISGHDGDTFRAAYTVRFRTVVYVLHAFQKTAKRGIATPESEIDLIKRRLRAAEQHYRQNHGGG